MYEVIKRSFDILIASIGLIISIPIGIVIAILIKIESKGKVIFRQERLGKNERIITIYKFQTMVENAEDKLKELSEEKQKEYKENYRIEKDPRVTKIGNFLRQSNLDEIPQLWNVLKGDLSLMGPRPILQEEIEKYGNLKDKLLSAKPGLTGYWQINRKNCKNYKQRIEMELFYVEHKNLSLDVKIFLTTIGYCIKNFLKLI